MESRKDLLIEKENIHVPCKLKKAEVFPIESKVIMQNDCSSFNSTKNMISLCFWVLLFCRFLSKISSMWTFIIYRKYNHNFC